MLRRSSFALVAALLELAPAALASTAPPTPTFTLAWGNYGSATAQFAFPTGVATDALGDVYVADRSNYRIQKFDRLGVPILTWGTYGSGDGQFIDPQGVAVDAAGNVYVADTNNGRIQKFTSTGVYLAKWGSPGTGAGQFTTPTGIAVDGAGNVLVSEYGGNRIQKFTASGTYVAQWGSSGTGNGQFSGPYGVATDHAGHVYVVDTNNSRIQKFTEAGVFITKWGTNGLADGQLNRPAGVATDALGNVFVADNDNHRIVKFTATGSFLTKWGAAGSAAGQFINPTGITVDAAGHVYIADFNNNRMQKFSSAGAAAGTSEGPGGSILKWGVFGGGNGQFDLPFGVTVDYAGDVYVVDQNNGRVQKFTGTGAYLYQFGSFGTGNGQFSFPTGITTDLNSYVYVADASNNNIQKFVAGGFVMKWGTPGSGQGQLSLPYDVAADASGNIYVVERGNHRVQRFSSTGAFITAWGGSGNGIGQFNNPSGIAVDAAGNVYVADTSNNRVQKFTAAGNYLTQWSTGAERADRIAVDAYGHVFVTVNESSRILEFTSNGTFMTSWAGALLNPWGVATDAAGNLFVADFNNNRIQKFAIPPSVALASDVGNDQGRQAQIRFTRSSADAPGAGVTVTGYEIYRRNDPLPAPASGTESSGSPPDLQLAGWTYVTTVPAHGESEYNVEVPTLVDANPDSPEYTAFMVRAATNSPFAYYDSGTEYGFSLDNLAPPAPSPFTLAYAGGAAHLQWGVSTAGDFATFRLYRGSGVNFIPGPDNLLATTTDTNFDDIGATWGNYKLAAVDRNGNESPFAVVGPGQTTGVSGEGQFALALEGPRPNPARGGRLFVHFTLASRAPATLELFDLAGRCVASRDVGPLGAGRHAEQLTSSRTLPAGVYLIRLTQGVERHMTRVALLD